MTKFIQTSVNYTAQKPRHIAMIEQTEDKQFRVTLQIAVGRPPYAEWVASNLGVFDEIYDAVNEAMHNARVIEFSDDII